MTKEQQLVKFICECKYSDIPESIIEVVKTQIVADYAAQIAGVDAAGIQTLVDYTKEIGGKEEATILLHGGKVPADKAAFVNGSMARAWDIDDHRSPGIHIGTACLSATYAAAELVGGCSGEDFLTAVAIGMEVSYRLNLAEDEYAGFDPTGINAVFASAASASWMLKLNEKQTLDALALAFNKCAGSFQSNVDGALAVRVIEGWSAETGVLCARLAQRGITGPQNFLDGVYGYFFLYGRGKSETAKTACEGLGETWNVDTMQFKKFPSCGLTQGSTQLTVDIMDENNITAADVEHVDVYLTPFNYKLVGQFEIGENPKVDAQFGVAYCIANALFRAPVKLIHFEDDYIRDQEIYNFTKEKMTVHSVQEIIDTRSHYSSDLRIVTKDGRDIKKSIDIPPGTPDYPITKEEHTARFYDCVSIANKEYITERADEILERLSNIDKESDVRDLFALFQC